MVERLSTDEDFISMILPFVLNDFIEPCFHWFGYKKYRNQINPWGPWTLAWVSKKWLQVIHKRLSGSMLILFIKQLISILLGSQAYTSIEVPAFPYNIPENTELGVILII